MKANFNKFLLSFVFALLGIAQLYGQGSTTSTISGLVTDGSGEPLVGVTVVAVHTPSGTKYGTSTRVDGRYTIPGARVGGPYTITAIYTGFDNREESNIYLSLGQVYRHDIDMSEKSTVMDEVVITATGGLLGSSTDGASTSISEEAIQVLPTVARDLTDFTRLTPQANILGDNTISIAGQNNRYNAIYIDGAVNNDVFGLAASGTNGGQTGISPISPDAIEQFEVVVAPYDVKLSGFNGGGINAVTRSGSNEIEGSAYFLTRNQNLASVKRSLADTIDKADRKLADFSANTYGLRVGGPLVKDKAFFFINAELLRQETPQPFEFSQYNGDTQNESQIMAFRDRLIALGYDPGEYLGKTETLDGEKILVRLDFNLNDKNKLMVRHHYTRGTATYAQASSSNRILFANAGIFFPSTTNSTAVELTTLFSDRMSNNLIIGYTAVNDDRDPVGDPFPGIEIQDGSGTIVAGSELFSGANSLEQKIFTLTDNFNLYAGKHTFTFGTHNEFFSIYNLFIRRAYGYYRWGSMDDFLNGELPNRYRRSYSLLPGDGVADGASAAAEFNALQLGFYAQDEIQVNDQFKLSIGVRADIPMFLDDPTEAPIFNNTVAAEVEAAGYDLRGAQAGKAPATQLLWSPRLGFNYDVNGDQTFVIRGGTGIFTSRVPFVWPGGMFTNNGLLLADLDANSSAIANNPNFMFQPRITEQYRNEDFGLSSGSSQLDLFAENFKYPQTWRSSLAFDVKLPAGMKGSVEGIFSKTLNNVIYENVNVTPSFGTLDGADNRLLYDGSKISSEYTDILLAYNTNEGYSYNVTAQVVKPFTNGYTASVAYTFGESKVINDLTSSQNSSNWRFLETVNGRNSVELGYSDFDLGHRINAFVSKRFEYGGTTGGATTVTLFYNGQSGQRYSYVYGNRIVRDDFSNLEDLIYVPRDASEINLIDDASAGTAAEQWAALDAFIEADDYLSQHRGEYAERNGARLPFTNIVDLKVMQDFFVEMNGKRRTLQVSLDVFNFTNMLHRNWGRRYFLTNDLYGLITANRSGTDTTATYTFRAPSNNVYQMDESGINSSLWQAQLGVRLLF
jgi:hypothetical protein